MSTQNPLGHLFHARDGGLHAPLDAAGLDFVASQNKQGDRKWKVLGTAVRYGVVGHFGFWGAMRLEAGSVVEAPGKHPRYRDILALYAHNSDQVLGRVGAGTLALAFSDEEITYEMELNPRDGLAQDVWARLVRGDINSASIGFVPVEGDWVEAQDNSLDADPEGEGEVEVFSISRAELVEVSLVAQGAFAGATSAPAGGGDKLREEAAAALDLSHLRPPVGRVAADVVAEVPDGAEPTVELELRGAMPAGGIVGDDETGQDASDDLQQSGEGSVAERVGEDFGGAAEPDGSGTGGAPAADQNQEGAQAEAEAQGLTLKDVVGRAPYELRKEFD